MAGLFDGTPLQRPVTCEVCGMAVADCHCPRDASGKVLLPGQQTAAVHFEKRPGGRLVTVVTGLDPQASDLERLLRRLKEHCAAGGCVEDGALQIQGDHRPVVEQVLRDEGYRVKML